MSGRNGREWRRPREKLEAAEILEKSRGVRGETAARIRA
jgi:hypothetical protein